MNVQAGTLGGRLKAIAVVCTRLFNSPSTRKDARRSFSMKKHISSVILLFVCGFTSGFASEEQSSETEATSARILGAVPDGTPPPPSPPKPKFIVPVKDVLETATHEQGGRTITIRQVKPIALPPPPEPVESSAAEVTADFTQRLAEYREGHPKSDLLFLSATVFRSKDSLPRTLVRYWPEGNGGHITFWSSADFALIAGGINSFIDSAADTHHLLMGWGNVDIDRISELQAAKGREYNAPKMPEFAEGKATFQIIGEQPAPAELVAVQSLHDLYNSELARLKTAYEGRETARVQREAYFKANPPQPKNITLNHWRIGKTASNGKGTISR